MDLRILGPLEVFRRGESVSIPGRKTRVLLVCLATSAGNAVSRDRLIDALWGDDPPVSAVNTLHTYITHLRKALDEHGDLDQSVISTHPNGYRLDVPADAVDAWRLEAALGEGRVLVDRHDFAKAAETLSDALSEWRGPVLEEFLDHEFAHDESSRLSDVRLNAEDLRCSALIEIDRLDEVIQVVEPLVAEHPLRERLWEHLMLALYRSGRQADALQAYRRLASHLGEIGLDPGPSVTELETRILERDPTLTRQLEAQPVLRPTRLPQPPDSFVGRDDEVRQLVDLLANNRLVTLTGIGGIGKSRLAIHVAQQRTLESGSEDRYVDLTTADGREVAATRLAESFGHNLGGSAEVVDEIARSVGELPILMVVDNAEHVRHHIGPKLAELVRMCPGLQVLVTSREPLEIADEATFSVGPLESESDFPSEAALLFLRRARISGDLVAADERAIASICQTVNGIPAAIEVVAAGARVLSIPEIAENLDSLIAPDGDRQSIHSALEWTYAAMPTDQQRLLRGLSIFPADFTFDALSEVVDPLADRRGLLSGLGGLIDRSLVMVKTGVPTRYRMLEVFRTAVLEWLRVSSESEATADRFIDYYVELAEDLEDSFGSSRWKTMLERVDEEEPNAYYAIDLAMSRGQPAAAARITGPLGRYWRWRGRPTEGLARLQSILASNLADDEYRAKVERETAAVLRVVGDFESSLDHAERARLLYEAVGDRRGMADATYDLGLGWIFSGSFDEGEKYLKACADTWRELNESQLGVFPQVPLAWLKTIRGEYTSAEAMWTSILTNVDAAAFPEQSGITFRVAELALAQGQVDRARDIAEEALQAALAARYPYHEAGARLVLARIYGWDAQIEQAVHQADQALEAAVESGNVEGAALSLRILGQLAARRGDVAGALRCLRHFALSASRIGGSYTTAMVAELAASTQMARQANEEAARLHGAARKIRSKHQFPLPAPERAECERQVGVLSDILGHEMLESLMTEGMAWPEHKVIEEVSAWFE